MRFQEDIDGDQLSPGNPWAHLGVHKSHEPLHLIQNGFNLELNGWPPLPDESSVLENCRLILAREISHSFAFCASLLGLRISLSAENSMDFGALTLHRAQTGARSPRSSPLNRKLPFPVVQRL